MDMSDQKTSNIILRLHELETEISHREHHMDKAEAEIFLADLNVLYEQYFNNDIKTYVKYHPRDKFTTIYSILTNLRIKLKKVICEYSSPSLDEVGPNYSTHRAFEPASVRRSDFELRIQKQKFLIQQIDSVQITDDVCAVKAQVLHDHIEKLFKRFGRNQAHINIELNGDDLAFQQILAAQIQQKVIDAKTRMKKLFTSNTQFSNATAFDPTIRATSLADTQQSRTHYRLWPSTSANPHHPQNENHPLAGSSFADTFNLQINNTPWPATFGNVHQPRQAPQTNPTEHQSMYWETKLVSEMQKLSLQMTTLSENQNFMLNTQMEGIRRAEDNLKYHVRYITREIENLRQELDYTDS